MYTCSEESVSMSTGALRGQKMTSESRELDLQVVVKLLYVAAGN